MADINIYGVLHNDTPDNVIMRSGQLSINPINGLESTNVQDTLEELAGSGGGGGNTFSYNSSLEQLVVNSNSGDLQVVSIFPSLPMSSLENLSITFNRNITEEDLFYSSLNIQGNNSEQTYSAFFINGELIEQINHSSIGRYFIDDNVLLIGFSTILSDTIHSFSLKNFEPNGVVSISPSLPFSGNAVTITFSRNLKDSDLSNSKLYLSTSQLSVLFPVTFVNGVISRNNGSTISSIGNYTIEANILSISLLSSYYIGKFEFVEYTQVDPNEPEPMN